MSFEKRNTGTTFFEPNTQVIRTSVPWRYEVQQIDVMAQDNLSIAEVYISLEGPENDTIINTYLNGTSWPMAAASLLDPSRSAADLAAALETLPSAGDLSVTRVPAASIENSAVASRHLVTFLSRGGDVPLLKAENAIYSGTDNIRSVKAVGRGTQLAKSL